MKLTFSVKVVSDGPFKGKVFTSSKNIEECRNQMHDAGFYTGSFHCFINGMQFPLAACQNLTALAKNKKNQWVLAPYKK